MNHVQIWDNGALAKLDRRPAICVVAINRAGARAFVPEVAGEQSRGCMRLVLCEEDSAWQECVAQLETQRSRHGAGEVIPTRCMAPARGATLADIAAGGIAQVPAEAFLLATAPLAFDAVALARAADCLRQSAAGLVQVDLALGMAGGIQYPFMDFLRYRMYMTADAAECPRIPGALENLVLSRSLAQACVARVAAAAAGAVSAQLVVASVLAEAGLPDVCPLLVGVREVPGVNGRAAERSDARRRDAGIGSAPASFLLQAVEDATSLRGEPGKWVRGLLRFGILESLQGATTCADGAQAVHPGWHDIEVATRGMLDELMSAAAEDDWRGLVLAAVLVDRAQCGAMPALECGEREFRRRLVRLVHMAASVGQLGAPELELGPLLDRLIALVLTDGGPLEAGDVAWCYKDLLRRGRPTRDESRGVVEFDADRFARFDSAMRAQLAHALASEARLAALEAERDEARAVLAEAYPGRLAMLILDALRGTWAERLAFPLRLSRLLWDVLVMERWSRRQGK